MKRKLTIVFATLLAIFIFQISSLTLQSHIVRPLEGGLANDPGQTNCVHCHYTYNAFARDSQFVLSISLDSAGLSNDSNIITPSHNFYTPHHTQWISINLLGVNTNAAPDSPYYGFQLTALTANDSMAGSFILVDPYTSLQNSATSYNPPVVSATDTIWYVGHANPARLHTIHTWYFLWSAPDSSAGPVTFYYTGNLGNGYDISQQPAPPSPYGDSVFTGQVTLYPGPSFTVGIKTISDNINSVNIYPVPFDQKLNADMYLNASSDLSITLMSLQGQAVSQLYSGKAPQGHFARSFDIADVAAGIYFVQVRSGTATKVIKVIKY